MWSFVRSIKKPSEIATYIKVARDVYNAIKPEDNVPFYDDFVKDLNMSLTARTGPWSTRAT